MSVHDRFMNDDKRNFKFRCNILANGWTEETVREIDANVEAPGQPVPEASQGPAWHQRTQYEGWYDRVDGHGTETETPIDQRNVPEYVHVRNAQRRAETATAKGQLPEPGKGRSGYQEAKGKGPGKGKGQKGRGTAPIEPPGLSGLLVQRDGPRRPALGPRAMRRQPELRTILGRGCSRCCSFSSSARFSAVW